MLLYLFEVHVLAFVFFEEAALVVAWVLLGAFVVKSEGVVLSGLLLGIALPGAGLSVFHAVEALLDAEGDAQDADQDGDEEKYEEGKDTQDTSGHYAMFKFCSEVSGCCVCRPLCPFALAMLCKEREQDVEDYG